jgi:hypothetical protein
MDRVRIGPAVSRALVVAVVVVIVAGVAWGLLSPVTRIPGRIADEAAPGGDWRLVVGTDPDDRGGVAGVPVVGALVEPGRGEWVWQVFGPRENVRDAVVSWLLQAPAPDLLNDPAGAHDVVPTRGLEGRSWDGRVAADGTVTLTGVAASALRSVTVTVVVQPVMLLDDLTEVTVRVD